MTLSDPLLKELKSYVAILTQNQGKPFSDNGDNNDTLFLLCHCLEAIFVKGLIRHDGFNIWKTDTFQWFYQGVRKYQRIIPTVFKLAFEDVLNDSKTKTPIGKTRLLIRACLKKRCLFIPIQLHVENQDYLNTNLKMNYNQDTSILGHEIFSQIFLSLLQQISLYDFNLDLRNSSFLDESWQIPSSELVELVPCSQLGFILGFPLGYPVIVEIKANSIAEELGDKISVGDIVDEINGEFLRSLYGSKIVDLFNKVKTRPIKIVFIKGRNPKTSQVYLPIIKLYRILGFDPNPNPSTGNQMDPLSHPEQQQKLSQNNDAKNDQNDRSQFTGQLENEQLIV